jgi:hypothetical protein
MYWLVVAVVAVVALVAVVVAVVARLGLRRDRCVDQASSCVPHGNLLRREDCRFERPHG